MFWQKKKCLKSVKKGQLMIKDKKFGVNIMQNIDFTDRMRHEMLLSEKKLEKLDSVKVSNLDSLNVVDIKQPSLSEQQQKLIDSVYLILEGVKLEKSSLFFLGKDGDYCFEMSLKKLVLKLIVDNQEKKYTYNLHSGECHINGVQSEQNIQVFFKRLKKVIEDVENDNCEYMQKKK